MNKKSENVYVIEPSEKMNVPVEIYASPKILELLKNDKAIEQAKNVAALPGIIKKSIVMPDAHQGYGFSIGGVAAFSAKTGIISPGGIGFDINCGVRLQATSLTESEIKPRMNELMQQLLEQIPVGQGREGQLRLTHEELDVVLKQGLYWAKEQGYALQDDVDRCEAHGRLEQADPSKVPIRAKKRGKNQLGTLGGGNHFVEIQVVDEIFDTNTAKTFRLEKKGQVVIMIHSGSRGLGHQTCSEYLRQMEDSYEKVVASLPEKDLIYAPITDAVAQDYFAAMCACANFAWVNRFLMAHAAKKAIHSVFDDSVQVLSVYDVAHNICKKEEHIINGKKEWVYVHRKGATRAFPPKHPEIPSCYSQTGHPVLIPGSMGTPSYVLVGTQKGMEQTFGSTAHGAGRIMSRRKANETFDGQTVAKELADKGITVKAPNLSSISDEAPDVYKNSTEVVQVSETTGIGRIIARLRPIGVLKG